ncbi:glycosyl hydrolase family 20 [Streptomyces radicis]|uniref:Glycosyl hydrolase family 20 n=2 Tax=Streptomyces radicis TaxID=1750517 RepID=A0A3A9WB03_9ACTN|nr:glycosyl hydrolase family 20 [Streptomyces radicis]RKN15992.1 glycosyl hydrolase family 20 [Streptomyces radicis]
MGTLVAALALLVAPTVSAGADTSGAPGASDTSGTATAAPEVLPALAEWTARPGDTRLTPDSRLVVRNDALRADAETLADDLADATGLRLPVVEGRRAARGDIVLALDRSRAAELGAEGYELVVDDAVRVTGGTADGAFYGTRTVLQLLSGGTSLPRGRTVDLPAYPERGVGVCACYIHVSMEWFERLMRDMAHLKLNQLWIEAKVASDAYPGTRFWGYYTKDEVRQLSALARKYHITLVPEINSPGHMDPYLENHPELQLTDVEGERSPSRLDITEPAAFDFYTGLVDEALTVWDTPYWHMGADEYMLGSEYAAFPQIEAYARERFGPRAVPQDAFVDFVNQVNEHVRDDGRTLRIWNDGLTGDHTIPLDADIDVEFWLAEPDQPPSSLLAEGHRVMNAAYALYLVRGGFHMDTRELYESGWTPLRFEGETLPERHPGVTGAKITLWPDSAAAETENEVEAAAFLPLRFISQATWGSSRPTDDYDAFVALAERIGHAPGWPNVDRHPLPDGSYALTVPGTGERLTTTGPGAGAEAAFGAATTTWALTGTPDGYYRLRPVGADGASTDLCLDVTRGRRYLGAPLEVGAVVSVESCAAGVRTQRWQVVPDEGGVRLVNAISQLALALGDGGVAVQQAPDVVPGVVLRAES